MLANWPRGHLFYPIFVSQIKLGLVRIKPIKLELSGLRVWFAHVEEGNSWYTPNDHVRWLNCLEEWTEADRGAETDLHNFINKISTVLSNYSFFRISCLMRLRNFQCKQLQNKYWLLQIISCVFKLCHVDGSVSFKFTL